MKNTVIIQTNGKLRSEQKSFLNDYLKKMCIIINLYYTDSAQFYIEYINRIPVEIAVYIYSSKPEMLEICRDKVKRENVFFELKENRGRDVSALLVAAKEVVENFEIFCFIHDKASKTVYLMEDTDRWISNLWENMLHDEDYIYRVAERFQENEGTGLLIPPEPLGEFIRAFYCTAWGNNFEKTEKLLNQLNSEPELSRTESPSALSTVFWARRTALRKLLDVSWKYDDFPEEPMPEDGTISHAIERSVEYVAEEAGYSVSTIMTDQYAARLLEELQGDMRVMFALLQEKAYVGNLNQIRTYHQRLNSIKTFLDKHRNVYIFGAGDYGRTMYRLLGANGLDIKGFVVSDYHRTQSMIEGKKVHELREIHRDEDVGFIIAVGYETQEEIVSILRENGFKNYIYGY